MQRENACVLDDNAPRCQRSNLGTRIEIGTGRRTRNEKKKSFNLHQNSPGSRLRTSTDSLRGEILSAATTQSALRLRRYSTRNAVIGDPPLALGIQVTYTELSVAMEMVGRSGASGTGADTAVKNGL